MNQLRSLITIGGLFLLLSSCSRFVTQDMVETSVKATSNPHKLDIYYGEDEVPYAYQTTGYFEWRRIEGFTHRKKIGKKMLKKTNRYINRGNLPKPDGIIITDFIHATYIKYTGEKSTAVLAPNSQKNEQGVVSAQKKEIDFSPTYLSPNDPSAPKLRIGAGITSMLNRRGASFVGLNIRGNYWLGKNAAISAELTPYLPNRQIFRLNATLNYQYYLNFKQLQIAPIELSVYPLGGLSLGYNRQAYGFTTSEGKTGESYLLTNFNLGVGAEYRLSDLISTYFELGGMFFLTSRTRTARPAFALGGGLSYWLTPKN